jgi:hypothetical protein
LWTTKPVAVKCRVLGSGKDGVLGFRKGGRRE